MGKRGPAPKPTALRVIEGNRGKRPVNKAEPKPSPIRPTRPEWMLPEAKREWNRVVPELERMGLLTVVDRAALAAYCQAYARGVDAERLLRKKGMSFTTPNGYEQQRPEVAIAMKEWQVVRAFASEFGFTPAARTRISVGKVDEPDPTEAYL